MWWRQLVKQGARTGATRSSGAVGAVLCVGLVLVSSAAATGDEAAERPEFRPLEVPRDPPAPAWLLDLRTTEAPASVQIGPFVSVQVNVDARGDNIVGDAANEPSLAISPVDPSQLVIGWRQFDSVLSDFREADVPRFFGPIRVREAGSFEPLGFPGPDPGLVFGGL